MHSYIVNLQATYPDVPKIYIKHLSDGGVTIGPPLNYSLVSFTSAITALSVCMMQIVFADASKGSCISIFTAQNQ